MVPAVVPAVVPETWCPRVPAVVPAVVPAEVPARVPTDLDPWTTAGWRPRWCPRKCARAHFVSKSPHTELGHRSVGTVPPHVRRISVCRPRPLSTKFGQRCASPEKPFIRLLGCPFAWPPTASIMCRLCACACACGPTCACLSLRVPCACEHFAVYIQVCVCVRVCVGDCKYACALHARACTWGLSRCAADASCVWLRFSDVLM